MKTEFERQTQLASTDLDADYYRRMALAYQEITKEQAKEIDRLRAALDAMAGR